MNVLLSLTNYTSLTGSEIYVYELARCLRSRNHTVTILANTIGGEILQKSKELGIEVFEFFNHPVIKPDIIHVSQPRPAIYCLHYFSDEPFVSTIHSQLIYEQPIVDNRIQKYICIRPQIKKHLLDTFPQLKNKTEIIYNGVDTKRFNRDIDLKNTNPNSVLFVGTFDHLRSNTINDLILRTEKEGKELVLVTNGYALLKGKLPKHVRIEEPTWDIEVWTKYCGATASVYLGRTTIEGWLCGKQGWIYETTDQGVINSIDLFDVPQPELLKKFDIEYMTDQLLEIYKEAMK